MDRTQLKQIATQQGIRPEVFHFHSDIQDGFYLLENAQNCWSVFHQERGFQTLGRMFTEESKACEYLLTLLNGQKRNVRCKI